MKPILKIYKGIGDGFAVIMILPVIVVGSICLFTYWSIKLPFWLVSRRMRVKTTKKWI